MGLPCPCDVYGKEKFLKKESFAGSKKEEEKNVFKNFGDCTGYQVRKIVRPHYPDMGRGAA